MNAQKMTQKSLEALQAAQSLAVEYENQALCPEHLFCALLSQQDGLIPQLFQKMGAEPGNLAAAFAKKVGELPHVTGTGRDPEKVYITPELDRALTAAEKSAAAMKDEYVSVEHLVLGMMDAPNAAVKEVLRQFSLDKTRFLEVLAQVRGNQRVTSDNPESTYDVLAKYGPAFDACLQAAQHIRQGAQTGWDACYEALQAFEKPRMAAVRGALTPRTSRSTPGVLHPPCSSR